MVDVKNKPMSREEKSHLIRKEATKPLNKKDPLRCVDDRLVADLNYEVLPEFVVRPEETNGAQMLGGSDCIFDIALELAPEDIEPDFDTLYDLTEKAHTDSGYVMGIHMDNHHDKMSAEEVLEILNKAFEGDIDIPGCGYDKLVHSEENPLGLSDRSMRFHKKYPNRTAMFIRKGVKISVLGGHHAPRENALAIVNNEEGMTLDSQKAHQLGQPSYNHDQKSFEEIITALANNADRIDHRWGENIRNKGSELYMKWYGIVCNELAGMTPVRN